MINDWFLFGFNRLANIIYYNRGEFGPFSTLASGRAQLSIEYADAVISSVGTQSASEQKFNCDGRQ